MAVQTDEIFGPVVTAIPFDTEDEVVAAANNTVYGLAAGVWSKDIGTAHRVGAKLRAGTVWLNTWHADDVTLPRGGFKQSGWGASSGRSAWTTTPSSRPSSPSSGELHRRPGWAPDRPGRRARRPRAADGLAAALVAGGLPVAEVTFRTPDAAAIRVGRRRGDMLVGAGTVLTVAQVDRAHDAGARFWSRPGLSARRRAALPGARRPGASRARHRHRDHGGPRPRPGHREVLPGRRPAVGADGQGAGRRVPTGAVRAHRRDHGREPAPATWPSRRSPPSVARWMVAPDLLAAGDVGRGDRPLRGHGRRRRPVRTGPDLQGATPMIEIRPAAECALRRGLARRGDAAPRPGRGPDPHRPHFGAWEGGGEYNVARGLRRCFGLRAAS